MQSRHTLMLIATLVLIAALVAGLYQTLRPGPSEPVAILENIRDYLPATTPDGPTYAVDASGLYVGQPGAWHLIPTPDEVIVSAVAVAAQPTQDDAPGQAEWIYIGAANQMAVYRSGDRGRSWLYVPLTNEAIGGVTDLAVDPVQRLLLVGTDTAGLFRLRDVGSSLITGGQLLLDSPVRQVAVDPNGSGLAFARTDWNLYRAEQFGLSWFVVEGLRSSPTALAMSGSPATVYVGTVDRGLLKSQDGLSWTTANAGLGIVPGSRLHVDTLAADPLQPQVLYIATSFLYGTTEAHHTPSRVAVSRDGALAWEMLDETTAQVAELLPVSGRTGQVYALTSASRTPQPIGDTPVIAVAEEPAVEGGFSTGLLAWIVAGLAALALGYAVVSDLRSRRPVPAASDATPATQPIRSDPR